VDFVIRWKLTLRLFGSRFFFLAIFQCGTQIRWKTKLLEVNIGHVWAPIFFPVDRRKNAIPLENKSLP
jgi:hypothetical protein